MSKFDLMLGLFIASTLAFAQEPRTVQVKLVQEDPFSAQVTAETTQTLTDGSHVIRTVNATIARDSEGRTRRDDGNIAFIHDPTSGFGYVIDMKNKSVRRFSIGNATAEAGSSRAASETSLGSQVMEGLQVDGTQFTRTLRPGQAGNDRQLTVVVEAWYSSELQTIILRKTTDPRVGETVYKLTNIQRAEPDHALFEVPAGYSVREGEAGNSGGVQ